MRPPTLLLSVLLLWSGATAFAPARLPSFVATTTTTTSHVRPRILVPENNNEHHHHPLSSSLLFPSRRAPRCTTTTATTSTTSLKATGVAVAAAITGAISGGLFAGGLHAIAGPDHLAALLPRCCGQRWFRAGRVGALWGMGHGVSATLLGVCAFALKNTFRRNAAVRAAFSTASHVTEIAVGLSLVLIGVMGLREAREWKQDEHYNEQQLPSAKSLSAAANNDTTVPVKAERNRAVVLNGLLHGFSWDGAPSLAPAIAVATWSGNLAFLSAYAVGTVAAMAIVTTLVGEGTRRAGQIFQRPDIPQKLSYASSILAIAIGVVWCGLGVAP